MSASAMQGAHNNVQLCAAAVGGVDIRDGGRLQSRRYCVRWVT